MIPHPKSSAKATVIRNICGLLCRDTWVSIHFFSSCNFFFFVFGQWGPRANQAPSSHTDYIEQTKRTKQSFQHPNNGLGSMGISMVSLSGRKGQHWNPPRIRVAVFASRTNQNPHSDLDQGCPNMAPTVSATLCASHVQRCDARSYILHTESSLHSKFPFVEKLVQSSPCVVEKVFLAVRKLLGQWGDTENRGLSVLCCIDISWGDKTGPDPREVMIKVNRAAWRLKRSDSSVQTVAEQADEINLRPLKSDIKSLPRRDAGLLSLAVCRLWREFSVDHDCFSCGKNDLKIFWLCRRMY